jgi:hypothetical protein
VKVAYGNGKAGRKDLSVDALLLRDAFVGTGKWGMMQGCMAFLPYDLFTGGGAQITERLIGKNNGIVLIDNKDTIREMGQDSILIW